MLEVELQNDAQRALDFFRSCYRNRYGLEPFVSNIGFATTVMKDIVRKVGLSRTQGLVSFFLKSDGDNGWYKSQGHSLQTFEKNIEKLHGHLALEERSLQPGSSHGARISLPFHCDNPLCGKAFRLECFGDELDNPQWCFECKSG